MPIWNPDCRGDDHAAVHQTYIHSLTEIVDPVLQAITAPCDVWSSVLSDLLGQTIRRLESQAGVHGRRVKTAAAQLDALGPPPGLVVTEDTAATPPLIALETGGGDIGPAAVMAVQEAPDEGSAAPRAYDPHEPTDVYAWSFAEVRPAWHQRAVEWSGPYIVDLRSYPSLDAFLAVRQSEPLPDDPPTPDRPDIY